MLQLPFFEALAKLPVPIDKNFPAEVLTVVFTCREAIGPQLFYVATSLFRGLSEVACPDR
jgi:hypothetical protein